MWHMARRYHIGDHVLAGLNPPGQARWKIIDGRHHAISVVIDLHAHRLVLWREKILIGIFPIAIGDRDHPTPLGRTWISSRVQDPEWRDPTTGIIYPPHDPGNFLGGYWLGFDGHGNRRFRGIGIHGWTAEQEEQWLGQARSHGCLRVGQSDLPLVFGCVSVGDRVFWSPITYWSDYRTEGRSSALSSKM